VAQLKIRLKSEKYILNTGKIGKNTGKIIGNIEMVFNQPSRQQTQISFDVKHISGN